MNKANQTDEARRQLRRDNSRLSTVTVLERLKNEQPAIWEVAEIVGQWVWVEFECKPSLEVREYLLDLGFHWNHKRNCWQHSCGKYSLHSSGDPRFRYMTARATEINPAELQPA